MNPLRPIGVIHSPFTAAPGTPIQGVYAGGAEGEVVVDAEYEAGLSDLAGFERIWLVYLFDRAPPARLRVVPFRDTVERGVFATRAPSRPNPVGLSVVRLLSREGGRLRVADLDVLDGTPLLDIKPYVPEFDAFPHATAGWLDRPGREGRIADDRFRGSADSSGTRQ
ncbi:MAG: tRNA (N6-threonylcarbamoyladenosine(37)-N6)-methyltransferase TrmO [Planctomycetes bacterium]|jgi:tRNA-Thr(GGU) m(6)t(6)A37 methyltransferase TsaA|nr:tRNA (N6-threonylcarbamoyladenosine(37)-N6)-methyltransferase TrmO [Planctomycetota bacterium]